MAPALLLACRIGRAPFQSMAHLSSALRKLRRWRSVKAASESAQAKWV
jgi:hypothetical protein